MKLIHEQPAEPSYFFHDSFIDLGHVIVGAFKNCWESIGDSKDGIVEQWGEIYDKYRYDTFKAIITAVPNIFLLSFYVMRLIATAAFTPIVCVSITIIQVALLASFFLILFLGFLFITLLDFIYCRWKAITSLCPKCQKKFSMPVYFCPKCGAKHDKLCPGYYGIFRRKCNCGTKLSTTFFNGRQKLRSECPECGYEVKGGGLHASWSVPVIGGPNSGKTCYISMAIMSLEKNAQKYNMNFEYVKNARDEYEQNSKNLSSGYLPQKTQDRRLTYYQFYLTPKKETKQQISLCDVAGELFNVSDDSGEDRIDRQRGFRYSNAFILIIDPLSIPKYKEEVAKTTDLSKYRGSAQPIDDMLSLFVGTLRNIFNATDKDLLNTDVAVVFTKADIPGLAQKIGDSAVNKLATSPDKKARYKTQNELCEKFLYEYEEVNFCKTLKSSFKNLQFFTCSALGHVMNGQPFVASNVEEPLLWLLSNKSSVLEKATKKIFIGG